MSDRARERRKERKALQVRLREKHDDRQAEERVARQQRQRELDEIEVKHDLERARMLRERKNV